MAFKDRTYVLFTLTVGLCLSFVLIGVATASEVVHVEEDFDLIVDGFEVTAPGTLPPGWDIVWNGMGDAFQAVSDEQSYGGDQSFRLVGRPGWSAVAQRYISTDDEKIGFDFKILIDGIGSAGEEHPAFFKRGAEGNEWGTYYGTVRFHHASGTVLAEDGSVLGAWQPQTWYVVRSVVDRSTNTYEVWLDGELVGSGLPLSAEHPELIDAVALVSGHAGVQVYYDDVVVFVPFADGDGDGVPDEVDDCPTVNPGLIDLNVDGCVDTNIVIADFLEDGVDPLTLELPASAVVEVGEAVADLELAAFPDSVFHMLEAVEILDAESGPAAAEAAYLNGMAAQTAALLAIEQAEQLVGPSDPNVIAATTLADVGIGQLGQLMIPEAVQSFLDAVLVLDDPPRPKLLVEVDDRSTIDSDWVKYDTTFATWREQIWIPIRVTNTGNVDLSNVSVYQTYSGFDGRVGNLAVGESVTLNVGSLTEVDVYKPRRSDSDPFFMDTTAWGDSGSGWVTDEATTEVDIIHPRLTVDVDAPGSARAGDLISVGATVTNTGDVVVRDVLLFAFHPLWFWEHVGDLAPGESRFYPNHFLLPDNRRRIVRFSAGAVGGRDHDIGIAWEIFGRSVRDDGYARTRIVR